MEPFPRLNEIAASGARFAFFRLSEGTTGCRSVHLRGAAKSLGLVQRREALHVEIMSLPKR